MPFPVFWCDRNLFFTADGETVQQNLFMTIIYKHPVTRLMTFSKRTICLICSLLFGFCCLLSSHLPSISIVPQPVSVSPSLSLQDQTSQSADPSRTNPSRSPLCRAANTAVQAPRTPLLQTPNSELQTDPVLVEKLPTGWMHTHLHTTYCVVQ